MTVLMSVHEAKEKHQPRISRKNIDRLFDHFNKYLNGNPDQYFTLHVNTGLDSVNELSDDEFYQATVEANNKGWDLVRYSDNYQSTSYKLSIKPDEII